MSRPNMHRGKSVDGGEWVFGYLIGNDVIVGDIVEFNDEYFNCEYWYKVDPETVGQYTGRNDLNKKELYKGDVIKYSYVYKERTLEFTAFIDWSDEILGYCLRNMDGTWKSEMHSYDFEENSLVIGNVNEHSEMLEGVGCNE